MSETTAGSVRELLAGATEVTPIESAGKSGARLDRVEHRRRAVRREVPRPRRRLDDARRRRRRRRGPRAVAARDPRPPPRLHRPADRRDGPRGGVTVLLMRDVGDVAGPGRPTTRSPLDQHLPVPRPHGRAARPRSGRPTSTSTSCLPLRRYLELSPRHSRAPRRRSARPALVPRLIGEGWPLFAEVAPQRGRGRRPAGPRSGPAGRRALAATPGTLRPRQLEARQPRHRRPDGRTILLDWEMPGRGRRR